VALKCYLCTLDGIWPPKKILQRPLFAQKLFFPTGKGSANPTNEDGAVVIEGVSISGMDLVHINIAIICSIQK